MSASYLAGVSRDRIKHLTTSEKQIYLSRRPKSAEIAGSASPFLENVPMHWMRDWPMPFLPIVKTATKAKITDIDGNELDDFCLGDTGSMFGHSPEPVAKAIREQSEAGLTYMLPTMNAQEAGHLLSERFGPFRWQIATTATDANRFSIRVARAVTGRSKILVFNGCYHGTVDDAMVELAAGKTVSRQGLVGQIQDLTLGAVACEFNDLERVEQLLAAGDVAAILTEPVMTNSCMVLPEEGFHSGLRKLATRYRTLLIVDETHTISSGLGGYTRVHGLQPDMFVVGKCIAGGIPTAVWGMTESVAERYRDYDIKRPAGHSGMGTTLSGNPMQFACLRATLKEVMTPANYSHMEKGAERLASGLDKVISRYGAPWHVVRVGARVEFICAPGPLRNGTQAARAHMPEVERAVHLALLNHGCLIAPFHNMMLVSPVTETAQIDHLISSFDQVLSRLFS